MWRGPVDQRTGLSRLSLCSTAVTELRTQSQELGLGGRLGAHQPANTHTALKSGSLMHIYSHTTKCLPEEGVVLNTHFPNSFGSTMIGQLESDGALELLRLKHKRCHKTHRCHRRFCASPHRHDQRFHFNSNLFQYRQKMMKYTKHMGLLCFHQMCDTN